MYATLLKVIPLDFAATLSPVIFALALFLLGSKNRPKTRTFYFFLGSLIAGGSITWLGAQFGGILTLGAAQTKASSVVDLVIGLACFGFGIGALLLPEMKNSGVTKMKGKWLLVWLVVGFVMNITNLDAVFLIFTAAREVGAAAITEAQQLILLSINVIFYTLPVLLPLLVYLIIPQTAGRALGSMDKFMVKYSKYIMFALFLTFGIYFLWRGLAFFV